MKYYKLEPSVKKSVIEWHSFKRKDADGNTIFLRKELGWRYGSWLISVPETDEEIKEYSNWKHAIGQILSYGVFYPSKKKYIYLFGEQDKQQNANIKMICAKYDILVIYV